jgi:hypothetical protein
MEKKPIATVVDAMCMMLESVRLLMMESLNVLNNPLRLRLPLLRLPLLSSPLLSSPTITVILRSAQRGSER